MKPAAAPQPKNDDGRTTNSTINDEGVNAPRLITEVAKPAKMNRQSIYTRIKIFIRYQKKEFINIEKILPSSQSRSPSKTWNARMRSCKCSRRAFLKWANTSKYHAGIPPRRTARTYRCIRYSLVSLYDNWNSQRRSSRVYLSNREHRETSKQQLYKPICTAKRIEKPS